MPRSRSAATVIARRSNWIRRGQFMDKKNGGLSRHFFSVPHVWPALLPLLRANSREGAFKTQRCLEMCGNQHLGQLVFVFRTADSAWRRWWLSAADAGRGGDLDCCPRGRDCRMVCRPSVSCRASRPEAVCGDRQDACHVAVAGARGTDRAVRVRARNCRATPRVAVCAGRFRERHRHRAGMRGCRVVRPDFVDARGCRAARSNWASAAGTGRR